MLKPIGSGVPTTQIAQTQEATQNTSAESTPTQQSSETTQQASKAYATSRFSEQALYTNFLTQQLQSQTSVAGPPPAASTGQPELFSRGSTGPQIQQFQKEMNEWRVANGMKPIAEDGIFGANTETAVREFQKMNGLKEDGIAGQNTRVRMQMENSPEFKSLDPASKSKLRQCSVDWQHDPAKTSQLLSFVQDGAVGGLSPAHQQKVVDSFAQNPGSWMNLVGVYANDSFRKLDQGSQDRLLEMGTKNVNNNSYMKDLGNFMASPEIYGASPGQAKKLLDDFEINHSPMVTHEEWKNLDSRTQKRLGDLYLQWKDDPAKVQNLSLFVADGAMGELSPANRDQVIDAFVKNPDGWLQRVGIYANDNFRRMDDALKARTLDMATAHANDPNYIQDLNRLFESPEFFAMSNEEKAQALTDFDAYHMPIA